MNKRELYRMDVESIVATGVSKKEAIKIVAVRTNNEVDTIARALRAVGKKQKRIGKRLIYIPDVQVKKGREIDHIKAAAKYIVKKRPDYVVIAGDWHDTPSLSVFNSKKAAEGLRLKDDIQSGNDAFNVFMDIINSGIPKRKRPEIHITLGNHSPSVRIARWLESNPEFEGVVKDTTREFFESHGVKVYDYLDIANIEGIRFSHYIVNPHSLKGSVLGGTADTMLKNAGFSFIMGHQQGLKIAKHYLSDGTRRIGIVAGSFYPWDEDYMSPQANKHWRGIIMLNELDGNGGADICEVGLKYLMENYG